MFEDTKIQAVNGAIIASLKTSNFCRSLGLCHGRNPFERITVGGVWLLLHYHRDSQHRKGELTYKPSLVKHTVSNMPID